MSHSKQNTSKTLKVFTNTGKEGGVYTGALSEEEENAWLRGYKEYLKGRLVGMGFMPNSKSNLRKESLITLLNNLLDRTVISSDDYWELYQENKVPKTKRYFITFIDDGTYSWESIIKQIQKRIELVGSTQRLAFDISSFSKNYKTLTWYNYLGKNEFELR